MTAPEQSFPLRTHLLDRLHAVQADHGYLDSARVSAIAVELRIPVAEAWSAATSYPEFAFEPEDGTPKPCNGLSCTLRGAGPDAAATSCTFQCYRAPAVGHEAAFPEDVLRVAGPVMASIESGMPALAKVGRMSADEALSVLDASGLRGRGGAYFPTARKWRGAMEQGRPIALVINAEEGEPGVFKDRALLGLRPERFVEGLAIAQRILSPAVTIVFINGEARPARESLERALAMHEAALTQPVRVVSGGGGYVLGEESTLLNALEGRKPVPRLRPPLPIESGYFGMPTVINNVETIANLAVVFAHGAAAFRALGTEDAPGTKILSVSGNVERAGVYEVAFGSTLREVAASAGADDSVAALFGGPSGGFLPAAEFDMAIAPGPGHETGAFTGAGAVVFISSKDDIRDAALSIAQYNADEACGKCTPCREGSPRMVEALRTGKLDEIELLMDVVGEASLCGLGQAAPRPVRSALHFWPELFR